MPRFAKSASPRRLPSRWPTLALALGGGLLAACGGSNPAPGVGLAAAAATATSAASTSVPIDYPGTTNAVPASPAAGASRAGMTYNVTIQAPNTGDKVVFTVFEPATLTGGKTYPLIVHGHGFGGSRQTSTDVSTCQQCGVGLDAPVGPFVAAGYGVISVDERGFGDSGGQVRVMDPDYEGQDLLAVLDWAEGRLNWLAYGPSPDGRDPHNLMLGTIGGSYGGMFQYLIHNIDPKGGSTPWPRSSRRTT